MTELENSRIWAEGNGGLSKTTSSEAIFPTGLAGFVD